MALKETPKKVYKTKHFAIDPLSCRLCGAVGDASHWKNIFKPSCRPLLKIAEDLCSNKILQDGNLPHLLCRPCERRLRNTADFQKVILETQKSLQDRQSTVLSRVYVKRCIEVSPSVSRPPVKLPTRTPSAKTSLSFDLAQHLSDISIETPTLPKSVDKECDILYKANKELVDIARREISCSTPSPCCSNSRSSSEFLTSEFLTSRADARIPQEFNREIWLFISAFRGDTTITVDVTSISKEVTPFFFANNNAGRR